MNTESTTTHKSDIPPVPIQGGKVETSFNGIPIPKQGPGVASPPKAPKAPEVDFLQSSYPGSPPRYLDFKIQKDAKFSGLVLIDFRDGRATGMHSEPVIPKILSEISKREREIADLRGRLKNRITALEGYEQKRQFSQIEAAAARIRDLEKQIAGGEVALQYFRTVTGPAQLAASIQAKQEFFDMLKTELDRIDSEIAGGLELRGKLTAKPAATAKTEPAKAAGK